MKQVNVELAKTVAGIFLVGVGLLILRQHLNQAITQINHLLGSVPSGMFPVVIMDEAQQIWRTSGTGFLLLHALVQIFLSFWPLLLVKIGMGWSMECWQEH
ncbi:MAG: hypothetical protein ACM3JB_24855 [Acidobacteriaceae bacterium]